MISYEIPLVVALLAVAMVAGTLDLPAIGGRQGLSARLRDRDSTSPMPEFRLLLTEDERWALVRYLRSR